MIKEKFGLTEKEGKMMAKVARRSHQVGSVYTWEKFQAMGYLWVMIPAANGLNISFVGSFAEIISAIT